MLLAANADPDKLDAETRSPLYHAAGGGHHLIVRLLIMSGKRSLSEKLVWGASPLMAALRGRRAKVVKTFIEYGTPVNDVVYSTSDKEGMHVSP